MVTKITSQPRTYRQALYGALDRIGPGILELLSLNSQYYSYISNYCVYLCFKCRAIAGKLKIEKVIQRVSVYVN